MKKSGSIIVIGVILFWAGVFLMAPAIRGDGGLAPINKVPVLLQSLGVLMVVGGLVARRQPGKKG